MTQLEIVRQHLIEAGEISRNWCLNRFISRLGSRINDLKREGWDFDTEYRNVGNGKDYFYIRKTKPSIFSYTEREVKKAREKVKIVKEKIEIKQLKLI